jgi:hypothetical protein
MAESTNQQLPQ